MRNTNDEKGTKVLIAARDVAYSGALARAMELDGFAPTLCHDTQGVLRLLQRKDFDIILLDLDLDEEADVRLVSYARRQCPRGRLILLFDVSRIERAIEGLRQGAFFYLPKNVMPSDVALAVEKAARTLSTEAAVEHYEQSQFEELLGDTPAMRRVLEVVKKVAPTDSTVLLIGESGTGKEVMANTIHRLSARQETPFIAINCAALPEQLLESELFGHMKGAFTGADADKCGLFEEADRGTILLDEIGDMALSTQAKLLRVLQNGEVRPVGSSTVRHVDVRILAATNRRLEQAVAERTFREDLYFRLNVIQIRIPPLRERMDALPKLVAYFMAMHNAKFDKHVRNVDAAAESLLVNYAYPGNIRELGSIIAHAVIMADGDTLRAQDLPDQVRRGTTGRLALPDLAGDAIPSINEMEADLIRTALDRLDGNQTEAAKKLGISRSTLWRKMKEYNIER